MPNVKLSDRNMPQLPTLDEFLAKHNIPLRAYGKGGGVYLVFDRELPAGAKQEMHRLRDYYVSSAVSGPGYVLCVRIHEKLY